MFSPDRGEWDRGDEEEDEEEVSFTTEHPKRILLKSLQGNF